MKILLIVAALSGCAGSFTSLSCSDWIAQGALMGESAVDYAQTKYIIRDNNEGNPLIGSHGQYNSPAMAGVAMLSVEFLVAWALPPKARHEWEAFWLGAETLNVYDNVMNGYYPWGKSR